jgi:hypothetical protein
MLLHELPDGRLVEASSIFELWVSPERLTGKIVPFIEECFRTRRQPSAGRAGGARGARRRAS